VVVVVVVAMAGVIVIISALSSGIAAASDITLAAVVTLPLQPISSHGFWFPAADKHRQEELAAGNNAGHDGSAPAIVATMVFLARYTLRVG
jgi:hypothetical protein